MWGFTHLIKQCIKQVHFSYGETPTRLDDASIPGFRSRPRILTYVWTLKEGEGIVWRPEPDNLCNYWHMLRICWPSPHQPCVTVCALTTTHQMGFGQGSFTVPELQNASQDDLFSGGSNGIHEQAENAFFGSYTSMTLPEAVKAEPEPANDPRLLVREAIRLSGPGAHQGDYFFEQQCICLIL